MFVVWLCLGQDPTSPSRQIAVRICYLPKGTISLETVLPDKHIGTVEKLPTATKSPSESRSHQLYSDRENIVIVIIYMYMYL